MFKNAQIGDRVYDYVLDKWGVIIDVNSDVCDGCPIEVEFDSVIRFYTYDGRHFGANTNPILFWDRVEIVAPPRPFNLLQFLQDNLIQRKFIYGVENYYLIWNNRLNCVSYDYCLVSEEDKIYFAKITNSIIDTINDHCKNKEELFLALNKIKEVQHEKI